MSQRRSSTYNPSPKTKAILRRAMEHIQSVPYKVSARWVFYRLLQDSIYSSKSDYNKMVNAIGRARHAFLDGWKPDTLADETRDGIIRGDGFSDVDSWITAPTQCKLDKWWDQDNYCEIWFEARAMSQQFQRYTKYITLRPMGGQPSIPFKYEIARELSTRDDKNITILYFGDLDAAGDTIGQVAQEDIRKWSSAYFEFIWAGLTNEQVIRHDVPENFEHPGAYQWEALTDEAAREIIGNAVSEYVDEEAIQKIVDLENIARNWNNAKNREKAKAWKQYREDEGF